MDATPGCGAGGPLDHPVELPAGSGRFPMNVSGAETLF